MKHVRKIVALLLTAIMVFAMSAAAFASGGNDGKITVTNATVGEDYAIYKVFDATYRDKGDGTQNVSYTYTKSGSADGLYAALTGSDSPFTLTSTQVENVYVVALKDGKKAADISKFLTDNLSHLTQVGDTVTAASAVVTFTGLAYGYYYVTSSLGAAVTLDSALKEVTIIDKNQPGPDWNNDDYGKTIENSDQSGKEISTANYGDTVEFKIGVDTTNYLKEDKILEYYITDTMGKGLSYQRDTLEVRVGDTLLTGDDYTITYQQDGQGFDIVIKWYDGSDGFLYASPNNITVTYSATVTDKAVIAGEGNKNTAVFDYKTEKDEGAPPYHDVEEKTTTTYVYALAIEKVDENGDPLADAHFNIGNIIAVLNNDGTYAYQGVADSAAAATDFVSDENGMIVLMGVKAGTYTVTETKAPKGYNLLKDTADITTSLVSETVATTTTVYSYDKDGNLVDTNGQRCEDEVKYTVTAHVIQVENTTGPELPSTGGMGTKLFYAIGGLLAVSAGVLLAVKKRMTL